HPRPPRPDRLPADPPEPPPISPPDHHSRPQDGLRMTTARTTDSSSKSRPPADGISTFKGQERALRADRLGTGGLLRSVLAATAPPMGVAGVVPTTFAVMGIVGQPLLGVVLGPVLVLFSLGDAAMSRHVHNAGAFYAYISRGLGGTAG